MFQATFEEIVGFASEGNLCAELQKAREEFQCRTGQMIETDLNFERRIASFLEWYVLDRPSKEAGVPPISLYVDRHGADLDEEKKEEVQALRSSLVSLFEFKGFKGELMHLNDLLTGKKHQIYERRKPAGVETGDILEARLLTLRRQQMVFDTWAVHPPKARKIIFDGTKVMRKDGVSKDSQKRLDWVHHVAFLSNLCMRYKHVNPKVIFAELTKTNKRSDKL